MASNLQSWVDGHPNRQTITSFDHGSYNIYTYIIIIYIYILKIYIYVYNLVKTLDNSEFPSNIQWVINGKHHALRLGLRGCHFSDRQYLR